MKTHEDLESKAAKAAKAALLSSFACFPQRPSDLICQHWLDHCSVPDMGPLQGVSNWATHSAAAQKSDLDLHQFPPWKALALGAAKCVPAPTEGKEICGNLSDCHSKAVSQVTLWCSGSDTLFPLFHVVPCCSAFSLLICCDLFLHASNVMSHDCHVTTPRCKVNALSELPPLKMWQAGGRRRSSAPLPHFVRTTRHRAPRLSDAPPLPRPRRPPTTARSCNVKGQWRSVINTMINVMINAMIMCNVILMSLDVQIKCPCFAIIQWCQMKLDWQKEQTRSMA